MVALDFYEGRAVFGVDGQLMTNRTYYSDLPRRNGALLALNIIDWLAEPKTFKTSIEEAEKNFEAGQTQFESRDYSGAKDSFLDASEKFKAAASIKRITSEHYLAVSEWISKCDKGIKAAELLGIGIDMYQKQEYQGVLSNFTVAMSLFSEIEDSEGTTECEIMISEIEEILRIESIIQEANILLDQGKEEFYKGNFESALSLFQQAREKYTSVGSEKTSECDEWIQKTQAELEGQSEEKDGFCLGTSLLLVFVTSGFLVLIRIRCFN